MTVSIGILGCADIAARRIVPALVATPEARVGAVASRDLAKARALAATCGADPLLGYETLMERDDVTAVYVPLPAGLHAPWVRRALEAGKHVLAEKPLTTTAAETEELVALAAARGLVLAENYTFLHHGQHGRVRALLAAGAIGEVHHFAAAFTIPTRPPGDIRLDPALGGGALLDTGGYPVAAAVELLGPELTVVGGTRRGAPVDLAGTALLHDAAGVSAALTFGLDHFYRSRYEFWGSAGLLTLDHVFTTPPDHEPVIRIERPGAVEDITGPAEDQVRAALSTFVSAVLASSPSTPEPAIPARARLIAEIAAAVPPSVRLLRM